MINKNVIALGFVSFFTDFASSMLTSILPIFIVYVLKEGIDKLGFVVAAATFVSYAFRVVFGYLSDRYGCVKPFIVGGYLLSAITKPILYFADNWQQIAVLRGTERMGKAIRSASKDSLISAYSGRKTGKSFGFHKMMDEAGETSGAILAFAVLYLFGKSEIIFRDIFAFTLVPGIFAVITAIFFINEIPHQKKVQKFDLKKDYGVLPLLFIYFSFVFFIFNESFFMIKAKESGIKIEYIPLLAVVLNLTQTFLSYYVGVKIDKIGYKKIFLISLFFGIFSMIGLYFNFIVLGFIFLGIFIIGSLNSIRSYISINAHNKGTVYGILYGGVALFGALGAIIIGLIWKIYGESGAVIFSLTGLILILIIFLTSFYSSKIP